MKQRILAGLITMLLVVSLFSVSVMAQEDEATGDESSEEVVISTGTETAVDETTAAEINDNLEGTATAIDVAKAKINIWLTFNQEKKAEKEMKLARLQLIRARIAAKNNNEIAMTKALEAHNRILEKIQTRIDSIDGKSTEQGIKDAATKLVGLERAVEVHEARIAKLKEILLSGNLTEEQIAKVQEKISKVEDVAENLKEIETAKKDKVKTRLMAVAEMTEDKATEEIKKIEDSQNLAAVKKKVAEVRAVRAENAAEVLSNVIAKLEAKQTESGKDLSNAIAKLTAVKDKITARLEAGKTETETEQPEDENNETEGEA